MPEFDPKYKNCLLCDHELVLLNESKNTVRYRMYCRECKDKPKYDGEFIIPNFTLWFEKGNPNTVGVRILVEENLMLDMYWGNSNRKFFDIWLFKEVKDLVTLEEGFPYKHDLEYLRYKTKLYLKLS